MECNKDEAIRAKEVAEKKMENNDFVGARKFALKAKNLYPEIVNISQLLSICDVHCSAQNRILGSEKDWYGILQVEKFADESTIKKQYRRLALSLHPDKNRFPGAEGAFKLICEANAVLSDPTKKSIYDNKVRVSIVSAKQPYNHAIRNPQRSNQHSASANVQHSASANVPNGFSGVNPRTTGPSDNPDVFWTCCPFCDTKYQYQKQFKERYLRCQRCSKCFVGYQINSFQPGAQRMPSKPDLGKPPLFQEKVVPNHQDSSKVKNSNGTDRNKTVRSRRGCVRAGSSSEDSHKRSASRGSGDIPNAKDSKEGNEAIKRETGNPTKKTHKRGRQLEEEPSDSFDTSSESDLDDVNVGDPDLNSESAHAHIRRSSRKKQHVSYDEADEDGQAKKEGEVKVQKDPFDSKDMKNDTEHNHQTSFPKNDNKSKSKRKETEGIYSEEILQDTDAGSDKKGKTKGETGDESDTVPDMVELESDSGEVCCPDPEFSDFDKKREEDQFAVHQFWACYDTADGMPRYYAKVNSVSLSPFNLSITWLEVVPLDSSFRKWAKTLPVGCGRYKFGDTEETSARLSFSHQVHFEKGKKKGYLVMYPRIGEVWAIFKDWDPNWVSEPENHEEFDYETVEVLSDFVEGIGIEVGYLDKVIGFTCLFQRVNESFVIGPKELYKFSHCVPSSKMTGKEKEGVPVGSFELDPAALPLSDDNLYYPSKPKIKECRNGANEIGKQGGSHGT